MLPFSMYKRYLYYPVSREEESSHWYSSSNHFQIVKMVLPTVCLWIMNNAMGLIT